MVKWKTMVPLVSFLAALRILTEAQSCNNGVGKLVYEKISDYKLSGTGGFTANRAEVLSRMDQPVKVLEECVRRCQEDRTTSIQRCLCFDFQPGRRKSFDEMLTNTGVSGGHDEYEESTCFMYQVSSDMGDTLVRQVNTFHMNEICLTSNKVSTDCPNRLYVFKRIPGYRFKCDKPKEIFATNRTECEDKCLNEYEFVCRSATYDRASQRCRLCRETKSMSPVDFAADPNADYLENMCLSSAQRCTTVAFILEAGKELDGAFERERSNVRDFEECSKYCVRYVDERGLMCELFFYDDTTHSCVIYDEDSYDLTEGERQRPLKPSKGDLYRVICGTSDRDALINNATFECYRRKRLDGPHQMDVKTYSFQECLDECMRRYNKDCRSVEYSSRYQSCRFSSYEGHGTTRPNLIDDDHYDFYEFKWYRGGGTTGAGGGGIKTGGGGWTGGGTGGGGGFGVKSGWVGGGGQSGWSGQGGAVWPDQHGGAGAGWSGGGGGGGGGWPSKQGGGGWSGSGGAGGWSGGSGGWSGGGGGGGWGSSGGGGAWGGGAGAGAGGWSGGGAGGGGWGSGSGGSGWWSGGGGGGGGAGGWNPKSDYYPPRGGGPYPPIPPGPPEMCKPGKPVSFRRVGYGMRLRPYHIRRVIRAEKLEECEQACVEAPDFMCKSFNFRSFFPDNCELSDQDSKTLQPGNPTYFDTNTQFDYYEREVGLPGLGPGCLDVGQTCTPDGMEFTLRTAEGFFGRIYTYGFYDSCFFDGNGGKVNVLRISRANGFPRCGTQQYGDVMTNIVVVQFNDYVQTSRDKKYNLTCYFSGPGEAVVTSNYLDTRTDGRYPAQIEHLPAQNILTSNVVLRILYRGTPTNVIAVGDLLTFRLEARGHFHYDMHTDIFAINVIAKDPYSGRKVHLIDSRGCPIDLYVFPELHRTPDGALQAEFYAFKIPDSNLLVFQATVRTCRGPCEPVLCSDRARPGTFPSWGRKKRAVNGTTNISKSTQSPVRSNFSKVSGNGNSSVEEAEEVHELLQVYLSRSDIPAEVSHKTIKTSSVCVAQNGYYAMMAAVVILLGLCITVGITAVIFYRKAKIAKKSAAAAGVTPNNNGTYISQFQSPKFEDPSEPIYTDPSLFERSRSLRSLTITGIGKSKKDFE